METDKNIYVTPCVGICSIDLETEKCIACKRTRNEIASWMGYTHEERMVIMKRLGFASRKGGRRNSSE